MKPSAMLSLLLVLGGLFVCPQIIQGQTKTPEEKIQNAMSAAPPSIAKDATIMDWPAKEGDKPTVLRQGTNAWTCFPNDPRTPTNDPMCLDKMWLVLLQALMSKTEPKITAPGISYMLQGSSTASNTDPFAPPPSTKEQWQIDPPHTMVVVPGKLDPAVFPTDPHTGGPWIMWRGTPYEHLMVPVK